MLTAFIASRDPDTSWTVHQTHSGLGPILMLATWPAGSKGLHATFGQEPLVALGDRDQR